VQAAEKVLCNPAKMIDKALDTSSRAGGERWIGQGDATDGVAIHSAPIAYEPSVRETDIGPYTTDLESS